MSFFDLLGYLFVDSTIEELASSKQPDGSNSRDVCVCVPVTLSRHDFASFHREVPFLRGATGMAASE